MIGIINQATNMKRFLLLWSVFLMTTSGRLLAQEATCNCLENLEKLIAKTEENYAGFPQKVIPTTRANYQKLKQTLRAKTRPETSAKKCFFLLKEYVRFFADKHFSLMYTNDKDYDREMVSVSEASLKQRFATQKISGAEGIWVNPDGTLRLGIQRSPNGVFKAIVLESKDPKLPVGLVYFTLTPSPNGFIAKEYDGFLTTDTPAKQKGNLLQIWYHSLFGRVFPTSLSEAETYEMGIWKNNNNGLDFRKLSDKTAYIKIPTFMQNDTKIQELVSRNEHIIKSCENLIVDLTGNGGGSTGWVSLMPFFMTNPIYQYDTYVRVSPENIKHKLADLEPFVLNPIPDEYKKYFPEKVLAAYRKAYEELPHTKQAFYPIPGVTFPLDSILAKPAKVALIVDDRCGSSSEYFFSLCKQSKKTTTYGINTIGMMDYEGMSTPTPLPYDKYILSIPIVKSSWTDRKPIDRVGFKPDVLLHQIPTTQWVEFVQKELERN